MHFNINMTMIFPFPPIINKERFSEYFRSDLENKLMSYELERQ